MTDLPELKDEYIYSLSHYKDTYNDRLVASLQIIAADKSHYHGSYTSQRVITDNRTPREAILIAAQKIHKSSPKYFKDYQDPIPEITKEFNDLIEGTPK